MCHLNPLKKKKEQVFQFSDVCILVQGTTESETNKINIPCSSQLIVLIVVLDCLMSMSSHQMEMQGIITPTFSKNQIIRLTYLSDETRQKLSFLQASF